MRNVAKKLVQDRQLEFVTGGWVQPDEANTELYAMELQLQEGHDWIRETLGEEFIPKYGWSIDPFGYSPTMAYLLHKFGFEGMLIQRVHYAVKKELASKRQLEFMWRQTWDKTGEHDIFTHLMPFYSYDLPHTCGPDPSVCCQFDFARMPGGMYGLCPWNKNPQITTSANVHERAMLLLDQYLKKASLYRGNAVLIPIGDDFRYRTLAEADTQFTNYQAIFDYINKNVPNVQIQFGTLTLDRKLERVLFAAESLGATKKELQEPRRALSLFQHHDGVTGTAKTIVVNDYAERMHKAINTVQAWLQAKIAPEEGAGFGACWKSDAPRGLSQNLCADGEDVIVYNPLSFPQNVVTLQFRDSRQ
ncbi:alpha-mannosidase [Fragilaria crotonensis]|nr:alpha-mannosidase [Fragilaria crotonensis]